MAGPARARRAAAGAESQKRLAAELQFHRLSHHRRRRQSVALQISALHGARARYAALAAFARDSRRHHRFTFDAVDEAGVDSKVGIAAARVPELLAEFAN